MSNLADPQFPSSPGFPVTRRNLVQVAGVTLVATALLGTSGCASELAEAMFPRVDVGAVRPESVAGVPVGTLDGGTKPIYVTRPGSQDPVEHSVADTLFWGDIFMEHGMFFVMLMPGPDLAAQRNEAQQFQQQFADHLERLRGGRLGRPDYVAFNRRTADMVRSFIDYKRRMQEAEESGRQHSLVWPSFFDHTRKEAERFVRRLDQLNGGDAHFSRAEVVPFWADKMEEHSQFIAHLLDPDEKLLKELSETSAKAFGKIEAAPPPKRGDDDPVMTAVHGIIDFKTAAEKGISAGTIKSIIHPALADHVRREAIRFGDELSRAS
jgi:hypothetical protein